MCEWRPDFERLETRMDGLETRLDRVEASTQGGFNAVNANIETLSQQITNMDRRIIEEKVKWGDTLRGIVKWTVRALLVAVTYAVGVNVTGKLIPGLFH